MPPRTRWAAEKTPNLLSLPEALVEACLALCDQETRTRVLPLVCRAFRRLLAGPSVCLWRDITFELNLSQEGQAERCQSFLAWLARHASLSKTISLDFWSMHNMPVALPPALGEQLQEALKASLPSCEYLRLRWGGQQLAVADWISPATALTCLALSTHTLTVGRALASLTTLQHLELSTTSDDGPVLEPGCLPPSITRLCCVPAPGDNLPDGMPITSWLPEDILALPKLVYLDMSESWFQGEPLATALPRLTLLTSLAFDKCELPEGLPTQLSLLTRLRCLSFDGCIVLDGHLDALSPSVWTVLGGLTRLMSLSLSNCNLTQLPPAVAALPRMQHLYLEYNNLRTLPPGPYLRHLRVLSTDWEPLFRSHAMLLAQAPHLHKIALGSMSIMNPAFHEGGELPPLPPVAQLLAALHGHPALKQILLVLRPTAVHGAYLAVMEAILQLRGLRPDLEVSPIEHDNFFVEDAPDMDEAEQEQQNGGWGERHGDAPGQAASGQAASGQAANGLAAAGDAQAQAALQAAHAALGAVI